MENNNYVMYNPTINISDLKSNINKKIAVFFGNFQMEFLETAILTYEKFCNEYIVIRMPDVNLYNDEEKRMGLNKAFLENIDLFVYQEAQDEVKYGKMITDNIKRDLNDDCILVCVPNVVFKGYHPQVIKNLRNVMLNSKYNEGGIVPYGDSILEQCFESNMNVDVLEEYLYSNSCISEEMILDNLKDSFIQLKQCEDKCDVIISDYIENNYRKSYLFYSPLCPTNIVLHELAKRILIKLGYEVKNFEFTNNMLENDKFELLIYPVVADVLGLEFIKETFYFCKTLWPHRDTLFGYAIKYRKYCFPELTEQDLYKNTYVLSYGICFEEEYVEPRLNSVLTRNGNTIHLSLYLTAKKPINNDVILTIPQEVSPKRTYIAFACGINKNYPLQILNNGYIKLNKTDNEQIVMIDTMWHI